MSQLQSVANHASASTVGATITTQNLTSDSLLVCAVFYNAGTPSVSDGTNGAWTQAGTPIAGTGGLAGFSSVIFYFAHNTSTGKPTVTISTGGSATSCGIDV